MDLQAQPSLLRRRLAAGLGTGAERGEQGSCRPDQAENDGRILRRVRAAGLGVEGNGDSKHKDRADDKPIKSSQNYTPRPQSTGWKNAKSTINWQRCVHLLWHRESCRVMPG